MESLICLERTIGEPNFSMQYHLCLMRVENQMSIPVSPYLRA